ncbi:hypothetical protein PILCRDRAFT_825798 [Piloderma croceum F 1598]|uniref:Uncharacterized protein n=1 Tax=Piloderma croceum (strain F 1598) TaxID=765440 RepID=A0A0C3ASW3_PILCF|nr:hypothetical protein PILCRDRAFT_825798 [Piloderma croceum F 1598]
MEAYQWQMKVKILEGLGKKEEKPCNLLYAASYIPHKDLDHFPTASERPVRTGGVKI